MKYPTPSLWRVSVEDVHDGDTIHVLIDRGFDDMSKISIRLKDVWAPELADEGGTETRNFVLGWLYDHHDETDWPFLVETFRTPRSDVEVMTFNRYVAKVMAADGSVLNLQINDFVNLNDYDGGIGS